MMYLIRRSRVSGRVNMAMMNITHDQLQEWYKKGGDPKKIMPTLKPHEVDFLLHGVTEQEHSQFLLHA